MNTPLFLLHGALGSSFQFMPLEQLLAETFPVYSINFEGHGVSSFEGHFSIDLFVRNIIEFMDDLEIDSSSFFGYSMGGYVALKLAHDHPDRVNKIITLGTKFHWTPESAEKEVRRMNPELIEQKLPAFASTLAERHGAEEWKIVMHRTADMMTKLGNGDAMTEKHFASIENDVLVCIGSADNMVTFEESERTANQLKNGTVKKIEGFNHPLEAVDQTIIAEICSSFFKA